MDLQTLMSQGVSLFSGTDHLIWLSNWELADQVVGGR